MLFSSSFSSSYYFSFIINFLIILTITYSTNGAAHSTTNKIVNLNKISLNEDLGSNDGLTGLGNGNMTTTKNTTTITIVKRDDFLLFNFNSLISSFLSNSTNRRPRLEILFPSASPFVTRKFFYINESSHILYLNRTLNLDRESICPSTLIANTNQIISTASCQFDIKIALYTYLKKQQNLEKIYIQPVELIDLDDNPPRFSQQIYYLNISENSNANLSMPLEACPYDLDSSPKNKVTTCYLEEHDKEKEEAKLFQVTYNGNENRLYLNVLKSLDREQASVHDLTLTCSDSLHIAQARFIINVLDSNDNVPYFDMNSKFTFASSSGDNSLISNVTFYENQEQHEVIQIKCLDNDDPLTPNGQIVYSLPQELNTPLAFTLFRIDSSNGWITFRDVFDYEKESIYQLKIKCQDKGASNSVPVYMSLNINILDVNDNAPLAHFNFLTNEGFVKRENQTDENMYTIWIDEYSGNSDHGESNQAKYTRTLGYLTLSDADQPVTNNYTLNAQLVEVKDSTNRNHAELFKLNRLVDENDYENMYFSIELLDESRLDREQMDYIDLKFKLFDTKQSNQVVLRIILIDKNDNMPVFDASMYVFDVEENQLRFNFAKVNAHDADSNENNNNVIKYKILSKNNFTLIKSNKKHFNEEKVLQKFEVEQQEETDDPNFLFYIDNHNGTISLRGQLDREQCAIYVFTVRAENSEDIFNDVLVRINILDENDNQPMFKKSSYEFYLDENQPVNTLVGNVFAHDADIDNGFSAATKYNLLPKEMSKYFYVNSLNGDLLTRVIFDAETASPYPLLNKNKFEFEVEAFDSTLNVSHLSKCNVSVYLNDLNDNLPQIHFLNSSTSSNLVEINLADLSKELTLTQMRLVDLDRESRRGENYEMKINFVRRMSWPFALEIVKNSNSNLDLIAFIKEQCQQQQKLNSTKKAKLRDFFLLRESKSLNEFDLKLANVLLNSGIYNLSLSASNKQNETVTFYVKLFVYYNHTLNNSKDTFSLNTIIEDWWLKNLPYLIHSYKLSKQRKITTTNDNESPTLLSDNSDEEEDYFFSNLTALLEEEQQQQQQRVLSKTQKPVFQILLDTFDEFRLKSMSMSTNTGSLVSSSSLIIILMSFFIIVALMLISLILYKHFNEDDSSSSSSSSSMHGHEKDDEEAVAKRKVSTKYFVSPDSSKSSAKSDPNNDSSDSSTTFSAIFANNQSTKDLTSSPYLAASKFQVLTSSVSTTTSSSFSKKKSMSLQPRAISHNTAKMRKENSYKTEAQNRMDIMYIQKQDDSSYLCVDSDSIKNLKRIQNKNQAEFDDVDTNNVLKLKKINEEESFLANEQNISSNSENTNSTTEIILNAQYNNKSSIQYPLSTFIQQPTSQSSSSSSSTSSFNKFSNDTSLNSIKSSILASQNRENDPNLLCSPSSSLLLLSSSPLLILNQTTTLTTTNVTTTGSSASSSSTSNTIDDADLDCRNDADGDNGDKVSFKSSSISSSISNRQSLHLQNESDKFKKTQITNLYPLIDEQTHPSYQNKKNKDLNVNTYLEKFERIYNNFESTIDENDSKLTSRKPNFIQDNHYSTSSMYTSASSSSSHFNRKNNSSNQIQTFSYV